MVHHLISQLWVKCGNTWLLENVSSPFLLCYRPFIHYLQMTILINHRWIRSFRFAQCHAYIVIMVPALIILLLGRRICQTDSYINYPRFQLHLCGFCVPLISRCWVQANMLLDDRTLLVIWCGMVRMTLNMNAPSEVCGDAESELLSSLWPGKRRAYGLAGLHGVRRQN